MIKNQLNKFFAVIVLLLFALGVGDVWAGGNCGFYGNNTYIRLWVNGKTSVWLNCNGDGVSDLELGDVDELYMAEIRSIVWKNKLGYGNVCKVIMHYGINTSRDGSEGSTYDVGYNNSGYDDWTGSDGDDANKKVQQFKSDPDSWNLLYGLTPGTEYYLDFMFSLEGSDSNNSDCEPDKDKRNNNGGNYHVHFRVADTKSEFTKGNYLYFDARNLSNWQAKAFDTRFYFKAHYNPFADSTDLTCTKTNALEDWVYYVTVPQKNDLGRVQLNRVRPEGDDDKNYLWNIANVSVASARSDASQNCLTGSGGHWSDWDPSWTTYCPPMSASTLSDNGTTLSWGGSGTSESPYLIPTSSTIKVSASSTSALNDANMTKYYLFKKAGTAQGSGSSTNTKDITASSSTDTKEAITVEAYNYYNSTEGTHLASSPIYYEVRTPYTISYNAGTGGSGSRDSETKLKGVNFTLPNSAVFTRTGYTQTGWTTSDGGTQTHALGGTYTSDDAQEFFPVWTAKTYTVRFENLGADVGHKGSLDTIVTFNDTINMKGGIKVPSKTHYDFGGYYISTDKGETLTNIQIIDANGVWVKNVSGYTGEKGSIASWVCAGDTVLYAKWTEHEYAVTLAVSPAGTGTTSPASSTTAKYVTASGDISAIPASGYSFRDWDFSKTGEDNDVYSAGGYSSTSNPIHILAQHDGTLTANFTAKTYTVRFENLGADAGHKGSLDTTVTFNDTIHMKGRIEVPSKTNYDFGGYYTSDDEGETLGTQLIDENGNWKKGISGYTGTKEDVASWVYADDITLYAKWTETAYTITPSVSPAGAGSVNTVTDAHLVTPSSDITATPANAAWIFDYWECGDQVGIASGSGTNAVTVTAGKNSTITAHFKPRYELVGDIWDGSGNGGMPGWSYDGTGVFTFNSFTALGTGDGKGCDLSCSRTLNANTTYRFQIHDRVTGNHGYATEATYIGDGDHLLFNTKDQNVMLAATGAGTYTFRITNITEDDGKYYPTVSVERPHEVNFGQKYQDIDGTLHAGTTGGTAAATAGGDALTSGDYVTYNTSVTHTATAESGYTFAGWWSSDAFEENRFSNVNPMTYAVTSGDNTYAKFVETSTSVTLANDGHGKVQIGGEDATSTTCGVTTTRELTAVPNEGYKFSSWSKSGDDITISSTSTNPTTLRGQGAGATSGQTVTANFVERYSIKGTMNGENWGTTHTLSNIGTNAGSKDTCYVTMTLPANTTYEFAIYDEQTGGWLKNSTTEVFKMTYTNHTNWGFGTDKTVNCGITTAGKGTYKFIFNITDKTVTVVYPPSYQVNYGASVGGSVTSVKDDDNNDVPNGGYVRSGGSVIYTAAAASGYTFVGWCNNDSYGDTFNTELSWTNSNVTETQNSFAKFKSTNFVIYRTGDMSSDPRAAYDDVESYAGGTISEKIEYRMKVHELDKWYTLCLPFELDSVGVWDESAGVYYDLVPYYRTSVGGTLNGGHYIIRTPNFSSGSSIAIANFDDWRDPTYATGWLPSANKPYIIQWHMSYFEGKYVSFFGPTGESIPTSMNQGANTSSDETVNIYGNNCMTSGTVRDAYMLDPDYGSGGAWLRAEVGTDRTVLPFECFIRANATTTAKYRVLRRDMADTPTGWDTVSETENKTTKVLIDNNIYIIREGRIYTIQGTLVKEGK